jgi:hypothetical protein
MTEQTVKCPSCSTRFTLGERCYSVAGILRCNENVGHEGWHWSQGTGPGIVRWTGLYVVRNACPEWRGTEIRQHWCTVPLELHEGRPHNDGLGVTWREIECETCNDFGVVRRVEDGDPEDTKPCPDCAPKTRQPKVPDALRRS